MNEETFKVRAYGFGELAQLYFPYLSKQCAANQLRRWIVGNIELKTKLIKTGYKPRKKILTPAMVDKIISEFGTPY